MIEHGYGLSYNINIIIEYCLFTLEWIRWTGIRLRTKAGHVVYIICL